MKHFSHLLPSVLNRPVAAHEIARFPLTFGNTKAWLTIVVLSLSKFIPVFAFSFLVFHQPENRLASGAFRVIPVGVL